MKEIGNKVKNRAKEPFIIFSNPKNTPASLRIIIDMEKGFWSIVKEKCIKDNS